MFKTIAITAIAAFAAAGLGCDDQQSESGRVKIALTDAPGPTMHSATLAISEIYLQGEGGRVVLRDDPFTVDLVSLANSAEIVADVAIPDGVYGELRIVVDGAWIEVDGASGVEVYATSGFEAQAGGEVAGELKTPSWDASGLKLDLPGQRLEIDGDQRVLLLDFDLAETFQTQTGNGAWVMTPVINVNDIDLTTALAISVRFDQSLVLDGVVYVELFDREGFSEGVLELSDDDGDGTWTTTFVYLDPAEGPFTARFVTEAGVVLSTSPSDITIDGASGATVTTDIELVAILGT